MADLILGQPSNLTTVSAGGGGNVRVTYDPWELDWEFFDAIAIGHWLANTTTAVSDDIVAKGGSEHLGYWFEISTAFPDANWNTGNRITPQRQAAINQYATFALAIAAMALYDVLLVWYFNTANRRVWITGPAFVAKAGSVWGMLSRNQIGTKLGVQYSGDNSAQAVQVFVRNLTTGAVGYTSTVGKEGFGVRYSRLLSYSATLSVSTRQAGGATQIDNCFVLGSLISGSGINVAVASLLYNNTVMDLYYGYNLGNKANVVTNCVASECAACFAATGGGAVLTYCADTDGTLPVHATNLRNQDARTQLRFFYDLASPGQKKFTSDGRIQQDSVLAVAGLAIPAVPYDADGQLRPDPPSIGAWQPYAPCYAPGAEMIRGALRQQAEVA